MNILFSILVALFLQSCGDPSLIGNPPTVVVQEPTPTPGPTVSSCPLPPTTHTCTVIKRYRSHRHFKVVCDF